MVPLRTEGGKCKDAPGWTLSNDIVRRRLRCASATTVSRRADRRFSRRRTPRDDGRRRLWMAAGGYSSGMKGPATSRTWPSKLQEGVRGQRLEERFSGKRKGGGGGRQGGGDGGREGGRPWEGCGCGRRPWTGGMVDSSPARGRRTGTTLAAGVCAW